MTCPGCAKKDEALRRATELLDSYVRGGKPLEAAQKFLAALAPERAAWESAERHLRAQGVDPDEMLRKAVENLKAIESGRVAPSEPSDDPAPERAETDHEPDCEMNHSGVECTCSRQEGPDPERAVDPNIPPHSTVAFQKYGHANCDQHEGCRKANAERAETKPDRTERQEAIATAQKRGTFIASKACVCGSKEPHFIPPSLGEPGFYVCETIREPTPAPATEPHMHSEDRTLCYCDEPEPTLTARCPNEHVVFTGTADELKANSWRVCPVCREPQDSEETRTVKTTEPICDCKHTLSEHNDDGCRRCMCDLRPREPRDERIARLEEALESIADPIAYMRKAAKASGSTLNGMIAMQMANDANWLKEVARIALSDRASPVERQRDEEGT